MTTVHAYSTIQVAEALQYLQGCRVAAPSTGVVTPPHLIMVQVNGDYAHIQSLIRSAEVASNGAIMALPHPRDNKPLSDKHLNVLTKVVPGLKNGHAMKDVLTLAHQACPCELLDPELFCY